MAAGGFDFVLVVHPGLTLLLNSTAQLGELRPAENGVAGLFHQAMKDAPRAGEIPRNSVTEDPHPNRRTPGDPEGDCRPFLRQDIQRRFARTFRQTFEQVLFVGRVDGTGFPPARAGDVGGFRIEPFRRDDYVLARPALRFVRSHDVAVAPLVEADGNVQPFLRRDGTVGPDAFHGEHLSVDQPKRFAIGADEKPVAGCDLNRTKAANIKCRRSKQ